MAIKYTIWINIEKLAIKISTYSIARLSKIYPNWDFLFENITSGNTDNAHKIRHVLAFWSNFFKWQRSMSFSSGHRPTPSRWLLSLNVFGLGAI
jgi:hypothetical protein